MVNELHTMSWISLRVFIHQSNCQSIHSSKPSVWLYDCLCLQHSHSIDPGNMSWHTGNRYLSFLYYFSTVLNHYFMFIGIIYLQWWDCANYHRQESRLSLHSGVMCINHDVSTTSTKPHTIPRWLHREYINVTPHNVQVFLNFEETVAIPFSNAKDTIWFCGYLILTVNKKLYIGCLPFFSINW